MPITAYAAAIGHSVWFSKDLGESWLRAHTNRGGIYNESRCWSISTHPDRPGEVLSGTDQGVYRWDPSAERWNYLPSPMDGFHIQQIVQSPRDPDFILAGTRPAEIFRSRDGGKSWDRLSLGNATECEFINTPRVTSIHFDPIEKETIWVSIEIDAIYRSRDNGETWERLSKGLATDDVHNIVLVDEIGPRRILVSTEEGLHRSDDDGKSFHLVPLHVTPHIYCRVMTARADRSGVLFLSVGDRPSGLTGDLLRSRDWGETWEKIAFDKPATSTIWSIGTNKADPSLIFFCTILGQVWRSRDGGESWEKMDRELGELRMITWAPTP